MSTSFQSTRPIVVDSELPAQTASTNGKSLISNGMTASWQTILGMIGTNAGQVPPVQFLNVILPPQPGNETKVLQTDGSNVSWVSGAVGYTGSAGTNGAPGASITGFTGSAGAVGFTGSAGVGYTGSTGYTGSFDSSTLTTGVLRSIPVLAGNNKNVSAGPSSTLQVGSYVLYYSFVCMQSGTYRIRIEGGYNNNGATYARVYKNGTAYSTEQALAIAGVGTIAFEDLVFTHGDTISIYSRHTGSGYGLGTCVIYNDINSVLFPTIHTYSLP